MMQARIYQTIKSPTQSAKAANQWILDFIPENKTIDSTMGWSSSKDTMPQIKLCFETLEDAKNFAAQKGFEVEIIDYSPKNSLIKKSYSDNFTD